MEGLNNMNKEQGRRIKLLTSMYTSNLNEINVDNFIINLGKISKRGSIYFLNSYAHITGWTFG